MTQEENLKNLVKTQPDRSVIFSTGVELIPHKLDNGKWGWVVVSFQDGSYYDGEEVNVESMWCDNPEDLIGEDWGY
jgi:hypothetical protein